MGPIPPDPAVTGLLWALALLDGLVVGGVRHLVLSPGSRSTPVVLAAQRRPSITLTPILDERSAAFFALGLARASGQPVALLATSGSAPSHWYPAVMEGSAAGIPLILISADRPPELRGWGANQTTDQTRLFGTQVRDFHDPGPPVDDPAIRRALTALGRRAAAVSQGRRPGPVHINLPLREPLIPRADRDTASPLSADSWPPGAEAGFDRTAVLAERPAVSPERAKMSDIGVFSRMAQSDSIWHSLGTNQEMPMGGMPGEIASTLHEVTFTLSPAIRDRLRGRGLIYCGPDAARPGFPAAVLSCAAALGVPVLADPLSEMRFGHITGAVPSPLVSRYKSLVRNPQAARALRPDWVLRFGRAPISRTVLEWLPDIPLVLVDPSDRWPDPGHDLALEQSLHLDIDPVTLCTALAGDPPAPADPAWLAHWARAEARLATLASNYLATAPWCEAHLIRDLVEILPTGEGLLCANSLPIRQVETWSGTREAPLTVFGNRGLSGIDGQLSTLAGLNAGGIPTTGLLGDLSFLHDLSGLLLAAPLDRPCIVINNGGGRIFDYLPQHGLPDFERLWRTPRPLDLRSLALAFGLHHRRVNDAPDWRAALTEGLNGLPGLIIEVMMDAPRSQKVHLQFRQRVAEVDLLGP
jgi:2-succinyl-5-enolpyruvyl-6-hydroxy-3-cyclohexene-1-carboxylate synthase